MQQELMKVLTKQEMWELTTNETTGTMARWCTPSEMPKAREASPSPNPPKSTRRQSTTGRPEPSPQGPCHPDWSLQATLECPTPAPVTDFMALGMLAWTGQTRMESPLIPLMACRASSHQP
jgi:hypothetical protein